MRMAIFSGHVCSKKIYKYTYQDKNGNTGSIYKFKAALPDDRGHVKNGGFCDVTVFNHDGFMKYIADGSSIEGSGTFNQTSKQLKDGHYKDYAGLIASTIHFGTGSNKQQNQQLLNRANQNGGAIVDGNTGNPINGGTASGSVNTGANNGNGGSQPRPKDPFANDNNGSNTGNGNNGANGNGNGNNPMKNPFDNNKSQNGNKPTGGSTGTGNGNGPTGNGGKKIDISDDDLPF